MKKGKRVLGVIGVMIIMVSIISVSAGFWGDLFTFGEDSELEGELPESFDIGITMENSAPTIDSWSLPGVLPTPTSCSLQTSAILTVTVSDPDGGTDLSAGIVTAYLEKSGVYRPATAPGTPVTCVAQTPIDNDLDFECIFQMEYFDAPGSDWIVTVYAEDASAESATNTGATSQGPSHVDYPNWEYIGLLNIDYDANPEGSAVDTIEWTNPVVKTTTVNQEADNYLKIDNCGNKNLGSLSLTAQPLVGQTGGNTDTILPDSFSAAIDDDTPCDSLGIVALSTDPQVALNGDLVYGIGQTEDLYFCLEDIVSNVDPTPITVDSYASDSAWTITFAE